ncbi:hypothetical protein MIND_00268400 [Mycena indigotica]|uniref:Uncharacterized protein n=1 Tax=Mycena indigotica TaxID=2126181 RepID=A0A8H6T5N3_9AGAR|nr:uncharacterized protein MIND_00268400 [Mycena indigotica]KAF7312545.1 hypothetical protein MIND_00268400 [Mycena indigotica]
MAVVDPGSYVYRVYISGVKADCRLSQLSSAGLSTIPASSADMTTTPRQLVEKIARTHPTVCHGKCSTFSEFSLSVATFFSPHNPNDPDMKLPNIRERDDNMLNIDEAIRLPPSVSADVEGKQMVHLLVVLDEELQKFSDSRAAQSVTVSNTEPTSERYYFAHVRNAPDDCSLHDTKDLILLPLEWVPSNEDNAVTVKVLCQLVIEQHRSECHEACALLKLLGAGVAPPIFYSPSSADDTSMRAKGGDGTTLVRRQNNVIRPEASLRVQAQPSEPAGSLVHLLIFLPPGSVMKRPAPNAESNRGSILNTPSSKRRRLNVEHEPRNADDPEVVPVGGLESRLWQVKNSNPMYHADYSMETFDGQWKNTLFNDLTTLAEDLRKAAYDESDGSTRAYINHPACVQLAPYIISALIALCDPTVGETTWKRCFGYSNTEPPERMFALSLEIQISANLHANFLLQQLKIFWISYQRKTGEQREIDAETPHVFLKSMLETMKKNHKKLFFAVVFHPAILRGNPGVFKLGEQGYKEIAKVLEEYKENVVVLSVAPCPGVNFLTYDEVIKFSSGRPPTDLLFYPEFMRHWGFDHKQVKILVRHYGGRETAEIRQRASNVLEERCQVMYHDGLDGTNTSESSRFYPYAPVITVMGALWSGSEPKIQEVLSKLRGFPNMAQWQWNGVAVIAHATVREDRALLNTLLYGQDDSKVQPEAEYDSPPFFALDDIGCKIVAAHLQLGRPDNSYRDSDVPSTPAIQPLLLFRYMKAMGMVDMSFQRGVLVHKVSIRFVNQHMQHWAAKSVAFNYDQLGFCIHDIANGLKPEFTVASWIGFWARTPIIG